jgi:hypothetical protein
MGAEEDYPPSQTPGSFNLGKIEQQLAVRTGQRRNNMWKMQNLLIAAIILSTAFEALAQPRYSSASYNVPTEQQGWYDRNARY